MAFSSTSTALLVLVICLTALVPFALGATCSYDTIEVTVSDKHEVVVSGTAYDYTIECKVTVGVCIGGCTATVKSRPFTTGDPAPLDAHCDYSVKACVPESTKDDLIHLTQCAFLPDDEQPEENPDLPSGTAAPTNIWKSYTVAVDGTCLCTNAYSGSNQVTCKKLQ